MDFNQETMVGQDFDESADDALDQIVEEEEDEQDESESESLDSLTGEEETPAEDQKEPDQQATEPGWIKKRVEKAVTRAIEQTRAEMQAMFDQQMAPIRAKMMEDEAQELVRSRKVGDIETARELVRLRNGQPAQAQNQVEEPQQPRQANGRFAPRQEEQGESEAVTAARIDMLRHQADKIKSSNGPDVIAEFQNNEEIKMKVVSGEMDFYDVADYLREQKSSRKNPPSPMRSPNGVNGQIKSAIMSMTDKQFEMLEKRVQEGARFRE